MAKTASKKSPAKAAEASKRKLFILIADVLLVCAVLATLTNALVDHNRQVKQDAATCKVPAKTYKLTVNHDTFSQNNLQVHLCDVISITDMDTQPYSFNFGTYNKHLDYPGYDPQIQATNETVTIDAVQTGNYQVHDHFRDKAVLHFSVGPKQ